MNFGVCATVWLSIAVVSIPEYARAQWAQTEGPEGDYVFCIAADSQKVFISSNGGVLASTNSGTTWSKINFPPASVSALYSTGANLYAGTMGSGIYTSSNGGASWSAIDSGLAYIGAWRFDLFAAKDTLLYAHCWAPMNDMGDYPPGGLFRSTNNGKSWTITSPPGGVNALAIMGVKVFAGTGSGVFVSTDAGDNWIPAGLASMGVSSLTVKDTILFAGVTGAGVFRSTDEGVSWTQLNSGLPNLNAKYLVTDGLSICVASDSGAWSSVDNGEHWISANTGIEGTSILTLAGRQGELYAGTYGDGVFLSTDGVKKWQRVNSGLIHTMVSALRVIGANLIAGSYAPGRIFCSSNAGADWSMASVGPVSFWPREFIANGTLTYAATAGGVFRSGDGGTTWISTSTGLDNEIVESILVRGSKLFAACQQDPMNPFTIVMYTSADSGNSWTATSVGYPYSLHCLAEDSEYVYAGSNIGLLRSPDEGSTWEYMGRLPSNQAIYSIAHCGDKLLAGMEAGGVAISSDQGENWFATDLTNPGVYDLLEFDSARTVLAATSTGVFVSTNRGINWTPANSGLMSSVSRVSADARYIYGATGGAGVWRRPVSEIISSIGVTTSQSIHTYELLQNYPNPFNPTTTLRYTLPQRSHVTLIVFNTLGQQVATLVEAMEEPGEHSVKFDGRWLASGVYFYRLQAGSFVRTMKLVILR